jgi:hypothetical protein
MAYPLLSGLRIYIVHRHSRMPIRINIKRDRTSLTSLEDILPRYA